MHTIGNIIYGVPLTEEIQRAFEEAGQDEVWGFETLYDGNAPTQPGYLGNSFGKFNATADVLLSDLGPIPPSSNEKEEVHEKIEQFKKEFKAETGKDIELGEIGIWIVWSTS